MATGYIAQVTDGVVQAVCVGTIDVVLSVPEAYPGVWVEVTTMDEYPAPGWTFDGTHFIPPAPPPDGGDAA